MEMNQIKPTCGARKPAKRVGRGIGSGSGKTCGRGHKGQKSRSGGNVPVGFEGGQTPLARRIPKSGFSSRVSCVSASVRLSELNKLPEEARLHVDLDTLKQHGLVRHDVRYVKVFTSGEITHPVTLVGLRVSKGAQAAIEKAGGKVQ